MDTEKTSSKIKLLLIKMLTEMGTNGNQNVISHTHTGTHHSSPDPEAPTATFVTGGISYSKTKQKTTVRALRLGKKRTMFVQVLII